MNCLQIRGYGDAYVRGKELLFVISGDNEHVEYSTPYRVHASYEQLVRHSHLIRYGGARFRHTYRAIRHHRRCWDCSSRPKIPNVQGPG